LVCFFFFVLTKNTAPKILIFSNAMGANHLFYVKTIETNARAFLPLNILAVCSVHYFHLVKSFFTFVL
jgi:hypothetical protein